MLFEHLIYSTAIAIIVGMLWFKRTGRDQSWIIIASAFAPDSDIVAGELLKKLDLNILYLRCFRKKFLKKDDIFLLSEINEGEVHQQICGHSLDTAKERLH